MGRKSGNLALVALAAALAVLFLRGGMVGREAPAFSLRGAYGGTLDKDSFRGKPVLLVFWTTYCSICRSELPIVDRVAQDFGRGAVDVVAVNIGDTQGARDVLRASKITSAVDESGQAAQLYKVRGVPKLVLIDAAGRVRREATGYTSERLLRSWLSSVAVP